MNCHRILFRVFFMLAAVYGSWVSAAVDETVELPSTRKEPPESALNIAGIQASSGENDPRILYILPWQHPTLPRRPRTTLDTELPELMAPAASRTLENHRRFRQTLDPLVLE
jgi:hypothetical protein